MCFGKPRKLTTIENASVKWDENDLPLSTRFNDHYYSRHDGRAETRHVFLAGNGLPERWADRETFVIGELGFGTGLNFLETWFCWRQHRRPEQHLLFQSVEAFPLSTDDVARALSRWPELEELAETLLGVWGVQTGPVFLDKQTTFRCFLGLAHEKLPQFQETDAWFLDGFAPAKNPDLWSAPLMNAVADKTVRGGTFASYTAAGWVRRNLHEAGFIVEKRSGFGTKRDMIAGVKL